MSVHPSVLQCMRVSIQSEVSEVYAPIFFKFGTVMRYYRGLMHVKKILTLLKYANCGCFFVDLDICYHCTKLKSSAMVSVESDQYKIAIMGRTSSYC